MALLVTAALPYRVEGGAKHAIPQDSLCSVDEEVLFSCVLAGKFASVCGQSPGQAVYRFGRPGRTELQAGGLRRASVMFSGGGESQIHFGRSGYRYVLFDRTMRSDFGRGGRNSPEFSSGLVVLGNGRLLKSMGCDGTVVTSPNIAAYMREGDYIAH
jgi:hypothetical protein